MQLASNRLYLEPEKRENPVIVLEALALAAHRLSEDETLPLQSPRSKLTPAKARRYIKRGMDGLRLDMPDLGERKCRLVVTPSISGGMVLVIDRDLYRGSVEVLVTKAIQLLPEVLRRRPAFFY